MLESRDNGFAIASQNKAIKEVRSHPIMAGKVKICWKNLL